MIENECDNGPLIPARQVCARYKIAMRTLGRWLGNEGLGFPGPILINGRRYFRELALTEWEKQQASRSITKTISRAK